MKSTPSIWNFIFQGLCSNWFNPASWRIVGGAIIQNDTDFYFSRTAPLKTFYNRNAVRFRDISSAILNDVIWLTYLEIKKKLVQNISNFVASTLPKICKRSCFVWFDCGCRWGHHMEAHSALLNGGFPTRKPVVWRTFPCYNGIMVWTRWGQFVEMSQYWLRQRKRQVCHRANMQISPAIDLFFKVKCA